MQPLLDISLYKTEAKKALLLGKGPSYRPTNPDGYLIMGINHVVREQHVHIASIIDFSVIDECGDRILQNADAVFMPYYPHFGFRPSRELPLETVSQSHPILSKLREEGRLFAYNLSTIHELVGDSPVIRARFFTSEACVNLLGHLGIKEIRTLGVDGGKERASTFNDLENVNQERGYDAQWEGIMHGVNRYSMLFGPLDIELPVRIFIGAGPKQEIPALVLKYSILRHATCSVEVTPMIGWSHGIPIHPHNRPRTPFSFQRFMIPERCDYQGHAIYMDSDMLVFGDVKELGAMQSPAPVIAMRRDDVDKHRAKFSVIKMNCGARHMPIHTIIDHLDRDLLSYDDLVFDFRVAEAIEDGRDPNWNSLEEYIPGVTKLLHYTEMYNQPWLVNPHHPLGYLWFNELKLAVNSGFIDRQKVADHVAMKWLVKRCLEVLDEK